MEIIKDRYYLDVGTGRYSDTRKCYLITDRSQYLVTYDLYQKTEQDSSIMVSRSVFTNALEKITYHFRNIDYKYNLNVLALGGMIFWVYVAMGGIILLMIFYNFIPTESGKANLTWLLGVASVALFILYICLNIFYSKIFS
jgi:hypothetical protein